MLSGPCGLWVKTRRSELRNRDLHSHRKRKFSSLLHAGRIGVWDSLIVAKLALGDKTRPANSADHIS